jgi:Probable Zinc-ribbon domain
VCDRTQHASSRPQCARTAKTVPTAGNSLAERFPKVATEWHPTRNGDLTPDQVGYAGNRRAWWPCSTCGHEWSAIIQSRGKGAGLSTMRPTERRPEERRTKARSLLRRAIPRHRRRMAHRTQPAPNARAGLSQKRSAGLVVLRRMRERVGGTRLQPRQRLWMHGLRDAAVIDL